jgi:hypothetical protein
MKRKQQTGTPAPSGHGQSSAQRSGPAGKVDNGQATFGDWWIGHHRTSHRPHMDTHRRRAGPNDARSTGPKALKIWRDRLDSIGFGSAAARSEAGWMARSAQGCPSETIASAGGLLRKAASAQATRRDMTEQRGPSQHRSVTSRWLSHLALCSLHLCRISSGRSAEGPSGA